MILDNKQCSGCGACVQICPKHCIEMKADKYGFNYPYMKQDDCINCNLCEKICPISKNDNINFKQSSYAAINNNDEDLLTSASGGVFGAIAEYILDLNGVVYGCAWQDKLQAEHIRVTNKKDLQKLKGSKYVQSDIKNTFKEAKNDLDINNWVLYSGTPCQIAGLKSYLRKDYEKLITVDIICHGVPSQIIFNDYIKGLEDYTGTNITNIDFRSKSNKNWGLSGTYTGTYKKTNKSFVKNFNYFDNYYYFYFLKGYIYRESCYSCNYANLNRPGDFTIGDFWGAESFKLPFKAQNGCSLIIVNTSKGKNIIESFKINKVEIDLESARKFNKQLSEPTKVHEDRLLILDSMLNNSFSHNNKYFKKKFKRELFFGRLKYAIPAKIKNILNIIRYRYL